MPITIPDGLPAEAILNKEGVPIIRDSEAQHQDIRPLRIALLNLMPNKINTEAQLIRLLGQSPLQVDLTLIRIKRETRHTPQEHMQTFYQTWSAVRDQKFDGFIITGAPIEHLSFEEVSYWEELKDILQWSTSHVTRMLCICWGAQAALYHYFGIDKIALGQKAFGVYRHQVLTPNDYLMRGLNDRFYAPVSRHTGTSRQDIDSSPELRLCVHCPYTGPAIAQSVDCRRTFIFNHVEYDSNTLADEYHRDTKKRQPISLPVNYFPDDDPRRGPVNRWRSAAHLLFRNWLDDVYMATPYNKTEIGKVFLDRHLYKHTMG